MIPSEAEPREREPHQGAKDDVPPMMSEVGVARSGNVDRSADGNERDH